MSAVKINLHNLCSSERSLLEHITCFQLHDASKLLPESFVALPCSQYCCEEVVFEPYPWCEKHISVVSHLFRFFIHSTDTDGTVTVTTLPSTSPLLPRSRLIIYVPYNSRMTTSGQPQQPQQPQPPQPPQPPQERLGSGQHALSHFRDMSCVDGAGAPARRRERRLRAMPRHERQSIAMALAEAHHHSAPKVGAVPHDAPRSQKTASAAGERPALRNLSRRGVATDGYVAALPSVARPALAAPTADGVDAAALSFFVAQSLAQQEKEKEEEEEQAKVKEEDAADQREGLR